MTMNRKGLHVSHFSKENVIFYFLVWSCRGSFEFFLNRLPISFNSGPAIALISDWSGNSYVMAAYENYF